MSFFSLWVAARELSFGEGAKDEEDGDGRCWGEEDEEGLARLEVDGAERDAVCRAFELRLLVSPF